MTIIIKQVHNGYILTSGSMELVYSSLDEVFERVLQMTEGRTKLFGGDLYGEVIIKRIKE